MTYRKQRAILSAVTGLWLATLPACSPDLTEAPGDTLTGQNQNNLASAIAGHSELSILSSSLEKLGLDEMMAGDASYTILAPANSAMEAIARQAEDAEMADPNVLIAAIIREHIVPGVLTPDAIEVAIVDNGGPVTMRTFGTGSVQFALNGEELTVTRIPDAPGVRLAAAPMIVDNGVVYPLAGALKQPPAP